MEEAMNYYNQSNKANVKKCYSQDYTPLSKILSFHMETDFSLLASTSSDLATEPEKQGLFLGLEAASNQQAEKLLSL